MRTRGRTVTPGHQSRHKNGEPHRRVHIFVLHDCQAHHIAACGHALCVRLVRNFHEQDGVDDVPEESEWSHSPTIINDIQGISGILIRLKINILGNGNRRVVRKSVFLGIRHGLRMGCHLSLRQMQIKISCIRCRLREQNHIRLFHIF